MLLEPVQTRGLLAHNDRECLPTKIYLRNETKCYGGEAFQARKWEMENNHYRVNIDGLSIFSRAVDAVLFFANKRDHATLHDIEVARASGGFCGVALFLETPNEPTRHKFVGARLRVKRAYDTAFAPPTKITSGHILIADFIGTQQCTMAEITARFEGQSGAISWLRDLVADGYVRERDVLDVTCFTLIARPIIHRDTPEQQCAIYKILNPRISEIVERTGLPESDVKRQLAAFGDLVEENAGRWRFRGADVARLAARQKLRLRSGARVRKQRQAAAEEWVEIREVRSAVVG